MWPLLPSTPSPAIYNILDELKIITSTLARSEDDNGASSTLNDPENKVCRLSND